MNTKNNQTKRQLLNYAVLAGLLLGSVGALSTAYSFAQESQDTVSGDGNSYEAFEAQSNAMLESYGFKYTELTGEQTAEMNAKLVELDAEYEKIFAEGGHEWTAEQEDALAELDRRYDVILESYGFRFPELTDSQLDEMEEKLAQLEETFAEYLEPQIHFCHGNIAPEQEEILESLDMQYNAILQEYGFRFPELTDSQLAEMEERLSAIDEEYAEIFFKFDGELTEIEKAELEVQLDALDAEAASVMAEFGFAEPQLTEAQSAELDRRLSPLHEQYEEILADFANCS